MAVARVVSPALVGRETELSLLEDALLSALRGEGGVVVLGGEAGMGKSRLARELGNRAERLGCTVMAGACSEAELSLPYLPFLEAIGNYLTRQDLAVLRERLGPAADELGQLFPQMGHASAPAGDPIMSKLRLFEAIMLLLTDAARSRGVLLVIEDLHWADPATRELVDYSTRRLRSTKVMMLATYRTDELHRKHPLLPNLQAWRRSGQAQLVEIGPLDAEGVKSVVMAIFDQAQVSDEFRDFFRDRSEGNPFVLEEMLRDALDHGDIFQGEGGWDRKSVQEMRLPSSVRDTILRRLERLQPAEVEVLSAASAIGLSFDAATVAAVTEKSDEAVEAALEACVANQLLDEVDRQAGRYAFRHALTREAVYEDMVLTRRQQLHARIAEVLESRPGWKAVDLAHHLLMAGSYEQAVGMCVAAAEGALAAHAYRDAAELFERTIPHVKDAVERSRLMCRAADAYWNNAETATAKSLLEQAIPALEAAGLTVEAAGHRLLLGRCYWELNRPDLAREQFTRARDVLETEGRPTEALAIAYIRLAGLNIFDKYGAAGMADAERAAEIAKAAGSSMALAWSWNYLALTKAAGGDVEGGFRFMEDSYKAALAGNHRFQAGNAIFNGAWLAIHLGLGRRAQAWVDRSELSADLWPYMTGLLKLHQGQIESALSFARTSLQKARESGNGKTEWRSRVLIAQLLAESSRPEEALAELPPLSSRVEGQDEIYDTAARVRTRLAANDPKAAFADVRESDPELADLGSPADVIAEAAAGEPGWLRAYVDRLSNKDVDPPFLRAEVARGRLALAEGRFADGVHTLGAAVARFREEAFLLDAWHAERALAEAQFHAGDAAAATALLEETVSEADSHGARLAARLARDLTARLGIEISAVPAPALTARPEIGATGERMVSVLFADVRGYTEMTRSSAPGQLVDRIASLQRWAQLEVARHSGIVDKFAGDAVMATFNVSGQTVDHAMQAVQTAIAIIDKAALIGLPVGAGVAVGPAVVGRLAHSANVSVLGSTTNLAARLQAEAGAGEIVISEEAHRRVGEWLETNGHAAVPVTLQLKGFSPAVTAYRLEARAGIRA